MTGGDAYDRLARLEARFEEEITRLRAANFELEGRLRTQEARLTAADREEAPAPRMSRSQFLRLGGAAAAGAVAAGASGLLSARPAGAATGGPVLIGQNNAPTNPNDVTVIWPPSTAQLCPTIFRADNWTTADLALPGSARIALAGTTSGADSAAYSKVGVWGQTDDAGINGSAGVIGRAGTTGVDPLVWGANSGVVGAGRDGGRGVVGVANGGAGEGVYGFSNTGYGVTGDSTSGIALTAAGSGRLLQTLRSAPPLSGSFTAGEQIRDTSGDLWLCVTGGSPGTWRRAATVKDGFKGGSVNVLTKPIRLFDSRSAAPLPPGGTFDVQVTGIVVGGVSVPAGALALLGNVTVTQTQGPNGYLTLYPQGSPPSPATANINWFAPNQDLNTAVVAALNPANGKLTIHNGIAGGSAPTHVVLDAAAFVI